jgi:hypothetical protein
VTILASFSDVSEHRLGVALAAGNFFMHSAKWIFGFVVIEFRNRADWPPTRGRVAILTGYRKRTVRTSSRLPLSSGRWNPSELAA